MEKDKLDLINKIVVLIDTEDSLEKLKKAMRDILNSQWNEEEKNKKEYLDWKKKKQEEQKLDDDIPF
ncbi:MAG: hypothetical protein CBC09_09475 [Cellvibrionales bacterium TMED49]|nr:MAG: hypothetical protein CBC09_09475 [Cellvibrionales bacterium TMED49]|tara:strand:+ start:293 stop:493 length:201 start_codon:yes stop_codon:yes gene_type:complete